MPEEPVLDKNGNGLVSVAVLASASASVLAA